MAKSREELFPHSMFANIEKPKPKVTSEDVQKEVDAFLAAGGKIQEIPVGVSAYEDLSGGRQKQIALSARRGARASAKNRRTGKI